MKYPRLPAREVGAGSLMRNIVTPQQTARPPHPGFRDPSPGAHERLSEGRLPVSRLLYIHLS